MTSDSFPSHLIFAPVARPGSVVGGDERVGAQDGAATPGLRTLEGPEVRPELRGVAAPGTRTVEELAVAEMFAALGGGGEDVGVGGCVGEDEEKLKLRPG